MKKNFLFFVKVLFLLFLILLPGCQPSERLSEPDLPAVENDIHENEAVLTEYEGVIDEEAENEDVAESEEVGPNIFLTFSYMAGDFIVSPGENFLFFTVPSDPGALYHVIDLTAVEICSQSVPEIEWEAIEALPIPYIMGHTHHLQITDDGSNLLYATSEILWDESDNGAKTTIIFSRPNYPPEVLHQLELTGEEVPYAAFAGPYISPAWGPGADNIFYLTLSGIYRYSTVDSRKILVRPSAELPGLAGKKQLPPHAFYLDGNNKELAYYNEGAIYLVSLINKADTPEMIKVDTADNDIVGLEYLFGGKYLVLEDGYTGWGFGLNDLSLTFVDRQSGEVVLEGNDYLPAGYILDDLGQMFFKSLGSDNRGYFVLLDSSLSEISIISAKDIIPVDKFLYYVDAVRLDGRWALPLYEGMETHFAEIGFD